MCNMCAVLEYQLKHDSLILIDVLLLTSTEVLYHAHDAVYY